MHKYICAGMHLTSESSESLKFNGLRGGTCFYSQWKLEAYLYHTVPAFLTYNFTCQSYIMLHAKVTKLTVFPTVLHIFPCLTCMNKTNGYLLLHRYAISVTDECICSQHFPINFLDCMTMDNWHYGQSQAGFRRVGLRLQLHCERALFAHITIPRLPFSQEHLLRVVTFEPP